MSGYRPPPGSIPTLPVPDLAGMRRVHLVGIGGAGMSGLARVLLARGVEVSGSDLKDSTALSQLRAMGATVSVGHDTANLGEADAVGVSTAIEERNPELEEARRRGVPVLARAQLLAGLMRESWGIAVSGTHGKTTTTSMLAVVLERAGLDPTYVIGGDLNESGSNARSGGGDVFLAEADESDGSFLLLRPAVAVVTNVEEDHLDFYAGREEIEDAFAAFCAAAGTVVACMDDAGARRVAERSGRPVVWYGEDEEADVRLSEIRVEGAASTAALTTRGPVPAWSGELRIPVPGRQHLSNAAAAVAAAAQVGIEPRVAANALSAFGGVRRRWERRGEWGGAVFVDDYAHHPTEISATLAAARGDASSRVVAVFQPHRYSRTVSMWRALGESLAAADVVVVTDVYGAGEDPVPGVTGKLVVDALAESAPGKRVIYLPRRGEIASLLAREVRDGDLVLTLGAGDITMVGEETMSVLGEARERAG